MRTLGTAFGIVRRTAVTAACVLVTSAAFDAASPSPDPGLLTVEQAKQLPAVATHLQAVSAAQARPSDEAACPALASADAAQEALGRQLQRERDAIFARGGDDAPGLQRLEQLVQAFTRDVPGVGIAIGAETVYHHVRYPALANLAPANSGARRALRLAGELWPEPAGRPVYFQPATDVSGCMRPGLAVPVLRELAQSWTSVPACLQAQFRPKLAAAVDEMAQASCYCGSEAQTRAALADIDGLTRTFLVRQAGGNPAPSRAALTGSAARYSCH